MILINYIQKFQKYTPDVLLGVLIVLSPFLVHNEYFFAATTNNLLLHFSIGTIFLLSSFNSIKIKPEIADIIIILLFMWVIVNNTLLYHHIGNSYSLYQLTLFFSVYFIVRLMKTSRLIMVSLSLGGIVQLVVCLFQVLNITTSYNSYFGITGSFFNPASLSAYLGLALIATFYFLQTTSKKKTLLFILIIIFCIAIILLKSRAVIVGLIISTIFYYIQKKKLKAFNSKKFIFLIVSFLLFFFVIAFYFKKDSAQGRILIWKISKEMIIDRPLAGFGVNGFQKNYMEYQGDYFLNNDDKTYSKLADNVIYPFNEYLKIIINYGSIGFLFFIAFIFYIFKDNKKDEYSLCLKISILFLLIFAFFSYPFDIWTIKLIFVILTALSISRKNNERKIQINGFIVKIITLFLIISCYWGYEEYRLRKKLDKSIFNCTKINCSENDIKYNIVKYEDPDFYYSYGMILYNYNYIEQAIIYLKKSVEFNPVMFGRL